MFPKCAIKKIQDRAYLFIPSYIEIICTTYLFSLYRALEIYLQRTHGMKSRYTKNIGIGEIKMIIFINYFLLKDPLKEKISDLKGSGIR